MREEDNKDSKKRAYLVILIRPKYRDITRRQKRKKDRDKANDKSKRERKRESKW